MSSSISNMYFNSVIPNLVHIVVIFTVLGSERGVLYVLVST